MAKVTEVVLQPFTSTSDVSKLRVRVDYKIQFLAREAGQKYRIEVSLVAWDFPGDNESPPAIGADPKTIYNFAFGAVGMQTLYKVVEVHENQLLLADAVTADVPKAKLNEDPEHLSTPLPQGFPDEIRARVRVAAELLSNVQTVLL